jgi:DNA replication protein DnaC
MENAGYLFNHRLKSLVFRLVPELKGRNDYEIKYFKGMYSCINCIDGKADALMYRVFENDGWSEVIRHDKCDRCRNQEFFEIYQRGSSTISMQQIHERLTKEYYRIPEGLKNSGFKEYLETNAITSRAKEDLVSYTKKFIESNDKMHNLLIMGNPGTGKTHLCIAAARNIKEAGYSVGFMTTGQLLSKIKSTYNKGSTLTEEDILKDIKKLDLLILDDVGSEAIGRNDNWRETMLFEIVESRSGKPTIYTSNLPDTDLALGVGKRVYSRLYYNTKFVDLFTDDYRKNFQVK